MTIVNYGTLTIPGNNLTIASGGTLVMGTPNMTFANLTIQNGEVLTHAQNTNVQTYGVTITATNIQVDAGGSINVDGKGYSPNNGTGAGGCAGGGQGGGYGGRGGSNGNLQGGAGYGSPKSPVGSGSSGCAWGGVGGYGGGLVKLTVSGTLTLNGIISANGLAGTGQVPAAARAGRST